MHLRDVCGNLANDLPSDLADVPSLRQEILQNTHTGNYKDHLGYIHRYIQRYWIMDMLFVFKRGAFLDLISIHLSKLFSNLQTMEKVQTKQMLVLKTLYVWIFPPPLFVAMPIEVREDLPKNKIDPFEQSPMGEGACTNYFGRLFNS